jgi:gluconokinase
MALVIMGVSGSGKSTLGALIAKALGCRFLEGDAFHDAAAVAKMAAGHPLSDEDRWPWLDRVGAALGEEVAADGVAVAACSALKRVYRDRLSVAVPAPVRFVLLDNSREELARRVSNRPGHYMPATLLDSQLATLERPGPDEPAIILGTDRPPRRLCEEALDWAVASVAVPRSARA